MKNTLFVFVICVVLFSCSNNNDNSTAKADKLRQNLEGRSVAANIEYARVAALIRHFSEFFLKFCWA
jgi:hypothetical protein